MGFHSYILEIIHSSGGYHHNKLSEVDSFFLGHITRLIIFHRHVCPLAISLGVFVREGPGGAANSL